MAACSGRVDIVLKTILTECHVEQLIIHRPRYASILNEVKYYLALGEGLPLNKSLTTLRLCGMEFSQPCIKCLEQGFTNYLSFRKDTSTATSNRIHLSVKELHIPMFKILDNSHIILARILNSYFAPSLQSLVFMPVHGRMSDSRMAEFYSSILPVPNPPSMEDATVTGTTSTATAAASSSDTTEIQPAVSCGNVSNIVLSLPYDGSLETMKVISKWMDQQQQ